MSTDKTIQRESINLGDTFYYVDKYYFTLSIIRVGYKGKDFLNLEIIQTLDEFTSHVPSGIIGIDTNNNCLFKSLTEAKKKYFKVIKKRYKQKKLEFNK